MINDKYARKILGIPRLVESLVKSAAARNSVLSKMDSLRNSPHLLAAPSNLHLELTNRCNLKCRTCGRNHWDGNLNPLGDMSLETVRRLEPYLKRAGCINVWGYGESLLHPRFFEMLDYCTQFQSNIQLFTNGTTLTESNVTRLVERNLHLLVISLDGATDETVERTRSGLSLSDLIYKITRLNDIKARRGTEFPQTALSFTASMSNIGELQAVIHLAERLEVRTVYVSVARIFHPSLLADSLLNDLPLAIQAFSQAEQTGKELGVQVNVQNLTHPAMCRQPFELLFVKWNGDVFGCCASAFYAAQPFQIILGNVYENSLDEMWNGAYIKQVRKGLTGKDAPNEICRRCPYFRLSLDNLQKYPAGKTS